MWKLTTTTVVASVARVCMLLVSKESNLVLPDVSKLFREVVLYRVKQNVILLCVKNSEQRTTVCSSLRSRVLRGS